MSLASQPVGRRERNKQDKLDRIRAAASELFSLHGVDEVTTQQIADKADIGAGTLFLYAKSSHLGWSRWRENLRGLRVAVGRGG